MLREHRRALILIASSTAVSLLGWSGNVLLLPVATLFPALWSFAATRLQAAAVSAAYFLAASRGLPQGVATFYASDIWPGLLLWLVASSVFVFVHTALWARGASWGKAFRYLVVCALMAIPPFGVLGWAHPLTAAGVVFPDWGWIGLAAMAAGLVLTATRLWPPAAVTVFGFWLWSAAQWTAPVVPSRWHGVDLELGASLGRTTSLNRHRDLAKAVRAASQTRPMAIVLPESALGFWTPTVQRFWRHELAGTGLVVLAGAAIVDGEGYDNVLVSVSEHRSDVLYRERMPVPGSMWQPWHSWTGGAGGARSHFLGEAVGRVGETTIAPLICYELLLVWPVLQSMLDDADVIVAVGNGWWAAGTSIIDIQRTSIEAWARLFAMPLIVSFNT